MKDLDFSTCDLCDAHQADASGALRVLPPLYRDFGGASRFAGPIATVKCHEDNSRVREAVNEPGAGRVLVIDGGGSLRCALVGGNLGQLAKDNGWEGILINGCVRDTRELAECDIGIHALAVHPRKSIKQNVGHRDVGVQMPGAFIQAGEWIYADEDGVLVSKDKLHD
jgi:regulator of ribonuclease activity A